nr:hypothetical protein [uncultured Draconibacterium sp.]
MAKLSCNCPRCHRGIIRIESSYSEKETCTQVIVHECSRCKHQLQNYEIMYMLGLRPA